MIDRPSRRDFIGTAASLAAASSLNAQTAFAQGRSAAIPGGSAVTSLDSMLRSAVGAQEVPGIVALAASDDGILYEGNFGHRRLPDGPGMTGDTVFRIASMVKLITTIAALQLVERNQLSLDAPAPEIDPAISSPKVLDGFEANGFPRLRPATGPITLRQLLTHTAGFTYRLWDAKAARYARSIEQLPPAQRAAASSTPLMFDPGERWQYGTNIDWVGRIVESVSGDPLEAYFRQHILAPLGMNDTAFVISPQQQQREASVHRRKLDGLLEAQPTERRTGKQSFSGGGGIYSTAPDYLTLLRALMRGGSLNGARILRPDTVALMGQNQIGNISVGVLKTTVPALSNDVDLFPRIDLKWGFGHMINLQAVPGGRSAASLTWGGLFNTYYWLDPRQRVAAVFMTQVLPFADSRALRLYSRFERGIYALVKSG